MSIKIMTEVWDCAPVEGGSLLVLLALADSADEGSRTCFRGVADLARRARLSERQVIRCIAEMAKLGIVIVRRNASPVKTNLYTLTRSETWRSDIMSPTGQMTDVTSVTVRYDTHVISDVTPMSPKPSVTSEEPSERAREEPTLFSDINQPESKSRTSDRFEEFWKVYPKKDGKKKARENFARAVKRGADPDEIIAGARRYADACVGTEPHFVKWAQGWLTDERWTDLPEPAQAPDGHRISAPWGEVVR